MGCDIHGFMEYKRKEPDSKWYSFGGRINPGRNYGIFSALAGVRNYGEMSPVVEPRGIPDNMGYHAKDEWWYYLVDHETDESGTVKRETGLKWVEQGSSVERKDGKGVVCWVSDPDAHTPGWVTPDEFSAALGMVESKWPGQVDEPEYTACLAAMKHLESIGYEARFVFWFDN